VTGAKREVRRGIHQGGVLEKVEGSHGQHDVRQNRHEDKCSWLSYFLDIPNIKL